MERQNVPTTSNKNRNEVSTITECTVFILRQVTDDQKSAGIQLSIADWTTLKKSLYERRL